jgi:hypothetical protein
VQQGLVGKVFRRISRRQPHWVAVVLFEMYMDETGMHENARVTGASAYLARTEQWEFFEIAAKALYDQFGIEGFHATDYETFQGEFKDWDLGKKAAFAKCFFPLLSANTWIGIGNAVVNEDWENALDGHDELRKLLGEPYLGCFQRIIDRLLISFQLHPPDDRIAVFCEDNDFKGAISEIWDNWFKRIDTQKRLVSLSFGGKDDFAPLHAADALAYESYKVLDNDRYQRGRPPRRSLLSMQATNNLTVFVSTKENIPSMIAHAERTLALFKSGRLSFPWENTH